MGTYQIEVEVDSRLTVKRSGKVNDMPGCMSHRFCQRKITGKSAFRIKVSKVKIMVTGARAGKGKIEVEGTFAVNVKRTGKVMSMVTGMGNNGYDSRH
jgi:hypothetical protein